MRTMIDVTYADASNYKATGGYVLDGAISDAQRDELAGYLDDGEFFIPEQIGGAHLGNELVKFPDEDDHCWHTIDDITVRDTNEPIVACGTARTVDQFLARMRDAHDAGWDDITYGY